MCRVEDVSKVLLVDVSSGKELFSDSGDGDGITKDDGANLEVEVTPGISEKYLGLESLDNKGQWKCKKEKDNKEGIFLLKSDMVEKIEEVSKTKDVALSFRAIEGRKLHIEEAVLEERFVSPSNSFVVKIVKLGERESERRS